MSLLLRALLGAYLILLCPSLKAQEPLQFQLEKTRLSDEEVLLTIKSKLPKGVQLFSMEQKSEEAPYTAINFDSAAVRYLKGEPTEKGVAKQEKDPVLETEVVYLTDSVEWQQVARIPATDSVMLKGTIAYMYKKGEEYLPGEHVFKIFVDEEETKEGPVLVQGTSTSIASRSLVWIFLTAFGGGLLALLTPCVYSMIPITVSFFTKRSKTRPEGIRNALYYSASIVTIFTVLGFLITLIFGPAALNNMATNWIANLAFFLIFLIFGISCLRRPIPKPG
jgi:thiol:disulfide interchange protein